MASQSRMLRCEKQPGSSNLQGSFPDCLAALYYGEYSSCSAGVAYLLAPETYLAFGEAENKYQIAFEEKSSGGTAMFESLMKGMAAVASADVQKQMKDMLE